MKKALFITRHEDFDPETWKFVHLFIDRLYSLHPWILHADVYLGPEAEIVVEVDRAPNQRLSEKLFRDMARISTDILLRAGPHIVGAEAQGIRAPVR